MNAAYTISRTIPSTRLIIVATAIEPEDFSICDIRAGVYGHGAKFETGNERAAMKYELHVNGGLETSWKAVPEIQNAVTG
jgi:hypothetical protein